MDMLRNTPWLLLAALLLACPDERIDPEGEVALEALAGPEEEATPPAGEDPPDGSRVAPGELEGLRSALRPIDTPLPTRATLEGAGVTSDVLLGLLDDEDRLVQQNAARVLGEYEEVAEAMARLVALAEGRDQALRTAAIEGLCRTSPPFRLRYQEVFAAALTDVEQPAAGFAAIEGLRDSAEGRAILERQLTAPTHPAVERRLADIIREQSAGR
jgi:hypothetical protein